MKNIEKKIDMFIKRIEKYGIYTKNGFCVSPVAIESIVANEIWGKEMTFSDMMKIIENYSVKVDSEQIKEYLEKRKKEEHPKLDELIENKETRSEIFSEWSTSDIITATFEFTDRLKASKYYFDPRILDILEFCKIYIEILKEKSLKLLEITEDLKLASIYPYKISDDLQNSLNEYDIKTDDEACVCYEDLIRLITPLIQNIEDLKETEEYINNLDTYLYSKDTICNKFSEINHYPRRELQIKDLSFDNARGYIPLSYDQRTNLSQQNLVETVEETTQTGAVSNETPKQMKLV